jgi:hypothetical protein
MAKKRPTDVVKLSRGKTLKLAKDVPYSEKKKRQPALSPPKTGV